MVLFSLVNTYPSIFYRHFYLLSFNRAYPLFNMHATPPPAPPQEERSKFPFTCNLSKLVLPGGRFFSSPTDCMQIRPTYCGHAHPSQDFTRLQLRNGNFLLNQTWLSLAAEEDKSVSCIASLRHGSSSTVVTIHVVRTAGHANCGIIEISCEEQKVWRLK